MIPAVSDKLEVVRPVTATDPEEIEMPEPAVKGVW